MPKLSSRSKHEEFESNLTLQISDQKERRAKKCKEIGAAIWQGVKLSQPANFRRLRNCNLLTLCILRTVPPGACSPAFHTSVFFLHFLFLPILTLVIAFVLVCFVISLTLSTYISLSLYKICINQLQSIK